ncbi:MAG: hypothetical protein L0211_13555 [Planctomycetaceae bacterium]|nr:hypothetical protein [Planctomycetaceae bacterium]
MKKFSIRDILWLTILAAVAVAWWLDRRVSLHKREQLQLQARQLQYEVQIERAERLQVEKEIVVERLMLEAQAKDHEEHVKAAMKKLGQPLP